MTISTAVDLSAVARVVGIKTEFKNLQGNNVVFLPQRIAVFGQGSTAATFSTAKAQVFSATEVGSTYGFGSPLHLAVKQLLPVNGDGVGTLPVTVYPLDDDGGATASAGSIAPTGSATSAGSYAVRVNNIDSEAFVIPAGESVANMAILIADAINASLDIPITAVSGATDVTTTSKWKGTSANDLVIEIIGPVLGVTFGVTQHTGGGTNPDITGALAKIGDVWETLVINCMEPTDTATLDLFSGEGEGRWGPLRKMPFMVFVGSTEASVTTATAVTDARGSDRVNVQLVSPGSNDLPCVVAARQVARIAPLANNNPPVDYGSQQATGLVPGDDSDQWTYPQRDTAVKAGSSTVQIRDSIVNLSDTVTMYHPTGDVHPAYRHVVDVIKLQNIIFNLNLIFEGTDWNGAPLLPDSDPTSNRAVRKPKDAKAAIASLLDSLGSNAIISDPETAKQRIEVGINTQNAKRLDAHVTVQLSGNTNIISIDLDFGFFFGSAVTI